MSDKHWYILSDGIVKGPYSINEVEAAIDMLQNPLVWGRGLTEWQPPSKFKKSMTEATAIVKPKPSPTQRTWKVRVAGKESRPMSHEEMTAFLKNRSDLSDVELWTEGFDNWQNVFQIHNLMDDLGVSRRKHPRVPIMGTITFEAADGSTFEGRALSISEGGLGATETPTMNIGEKYKVILKSPNLYGPIHASVEVVFIGKDEYVGMKFLGIQTESKSAIIEYVRKFTDDKTSVR